MFARCQYGGKQIGASVAAPRCKIWREKGKVMYVLLYLATFRPLNGAADRDQESSCVLSPEVDTDNDVAYPSDSTYSTQLLTGTNVCDKFNTKQRKNYNKK